MTPTETAALVALVKSARPYQQWDEHSVDAWHLILSDVDAKDALLALKELGQTHKFIGTDDICAKVDELRAARSARSVPPLPGADPDQPLAYIADVRRAEKMIADGAAGLRLPELERPAPVVHPTESRAFVEWRAATAGQDEEFVRERARANQERCRYCGARVGETCTTGGANPRPLTKTTAHEERLVDAGLVAAPVRDRESELAELLRLAEAQQEAGQ